MPTPPEIADPEAMARFADDVRDQEEPFVRAATDAFEDSFRKEYRRLRASALESGEPVSTLQVAVRCNFDPTSRSVVVTSAMVPSQPTPRRKVVSVGPVA